MAKQLTRDEILNAKDLRRETVFVKEWGGTVIVRALTGAERDAFEASVIEQKKKGVTYKFDNVRAKLVQKSVIDEHGKPMFTAGDIEALGAKSAGGLQAIFNVAQRLSGLTQEDLEELEKN